MGNCHMTIHAVGSHHNDAPHDINVMFARFVDELKGKGHSIVSADLHHSGSHEDMLSETARTRTAAFGIAAAATGLALFAAILMAGTTPAMATDAASQAVKAPAPQGYPYTKCGVYFGIDSAAVTGSASQGEIGGLVGYSCPLGSQGFWFVEGDFNWANLNTTSNGISLSGPASLTQRFAVGSPLNSVFSLFPSLNLQVPTLPVLPAGVTVATAHPYIFGALHEQDIGVYNGLASFRQWQFSPGVGVGVLNQLSNGVALDVFAEAQMLNKSFCAPVGLSTCNAVGTLYRVGLAAKY